MWIVCITSVRHVLTVNGYGGRQTKENEKSWCFKGWETLVNKFTISRLTIERSELAFVTEAARYHLFFLFLFFYFRILRF